MRQAANASIACASHASLSPPCCDSVGGVRESTTKSVGTVAAGGGRQAMSMLPGGIPAPARQGLAVAIHERASASAAARLYHRRSVTPTRYGEGIGGWGAVLAAAVCCWSNSSNNVNKSSGSEEAGTPGGARRRSVVAAGNGWLRLLRLDCRSRCLVLPQSLLTLMQGTPLLPQSLLLHPVMSLWVLSAPLPQRLLLLPPTALPHPLLHRRLLLLLLLLLDPLLSSSPPQTTARRAGLLQGTTATDATASQSAASILAITVTAVS